MDKVTIFISSLLNVAFVPSDTYLFTNHSSCSGCIMCYLCPPLCLHYYIGDNLQHALWGFIWVLFTALNYSVLIYSIELFCSYLPLWFAAMKHAHCTIFSNACHVILFPISVLTCDLRSGNRTVSSLVCPSLVPFLTIKLCTCNKHNILFTTALYQASPVPSLYKTQTVQPCNFFMSYQ